MSNQNQSEIPAEKIEKFKLSLSQLGISTDNWTGKKGTKTVEELFAEIETGETELMIDEEGELLRLVHVVNVDITYFDSQTKKLYRLREDRQVSKTDGNVKRRVGIQGSVAEKMKIGENPRDTALRGMKEELGLIYEFDMGAEKVIEETHSSKTYPGLNSKYKIHIFPVQIDERNYKPEGYIEEQPNKTSYFVWEEVEQSL